MYWPRAATRITIPPRIRYQNRRTVPAKVIKALVIQGISTPRLLNMLAKVGSTKKIMATRTSTAKAVISAGYRVAERIFCSISCCFSKCIARRSITVSRMPPASPASTMWTRMRGKKSGCLPKDSARELPFSREPATCLRCSRKDSCSICWESSLSPCRAVIPERRMAANWRQKIMKSRALAFFPPRLPPLGLVLATAGGAAPQLCSFKLRTVRFLWRR